MNDRQRAWIEAADEEICKVVQDMDEPEPVEALLWCGRKGIEFDGKLLKSLTKSLLEYGKPQSLIDEMRKCWYVWKKQK